MTLKELRTKKLGLVEQIRSLKTANPTMTPEVQTQIDGLFTQVDAVSAEIASEERLAGHESELRESAGRVPRENPSAAVITRSSYRNETRTIAAKRTNSDEYKDALTDYAIRGKSMSATAASVLSDTEVRALSFATNTAGGYTVPTGFIEQLVIAQKSFGQFLNVCDYLDTDSGNPFQYPLSNDTANGGEISTEAGAIATNQDPVFSQVTLTPDKWDSGIVKVSYELLQDSAFNIDTLLQKYFAVRMARKLNNLVTVGSASGNIQGLVATAPSDSIAPPVGATTATTHTTTVVYADLNNLFYSVDAAYRATGVWIMSSSTMNVLSNLVDTLGRPLINTNIADSQNVTLLGRPIVFNEDMPALAASSKSIAFGDPKQYLVRRVGTPTLLRLDELYAANGQVGFLMVGRAAGRVLDAGTHPIKVLQQAAS